MVNLYALLLAMCCSIGVVEEPLHAVSSSIQLETPAVAAQVDSLKATASTKKKKSKRSKKEKVPAAAKVTLKRNVTRATFLKQNDEGYNVEVLIMDSGLALRNPEELQLLGSSGSATSNGSYIAFENIVLPFEGNIRFKSANKMKTVVYDREVNVKVSEPGRWVLRIDL